MTTTVCEEQDRHDMRRLAAGEDAALNDLMSRHAERLYHYLLRVLQNETEAGDLAHESFVRVYHHRAKFDATKKFSTWLYTIATNLVRDQRRHRVRHPNVSLEAERGPEGANIGETLPHASPTPDEALALTERATAVRRAISELPEDLRTPLVLSEYEEKSQAEIGAILGCSSKAIEMRLYRARQELRRRLKAWLSAVE